MPLIGRTAIVVAAGALSFTARAAAASDIELVVKDQTGRGVSVEVVGRDRQNRSDAQPIVIRDIDDPGSVCFRFVVPGVLGRTGEPNTFRAQFVDARFTQTKLVFRSEDESCRQRFWPPAPAAPSGSTFAVTVRRKQLTVDVGRGQRAIAIGSQAHYRVTSTDADGHATLEVGADTSASERIRLRVGRPNHYSANVCITPEQLGNVGGPPLVPALPPLRSPVEIDLATASRGVRLDRVCVSAPIEAFAADQACANDPPVPTTAPARFEECPLFDKAKKGRRAFACDVSCTEQRCEVACPWPRARGAISLHATAQNREGIQRCDDYSTQGCVLAFTKVRDHEVRLRLRGWRRYYPKVLIEDTRTGRRAYAKVLPNTGDERPGFVTLEANLDAAGKEREGRPATDGDVVLRLSADRMQFDSVRGSELQLFPDAGTPPREARYEPRTGQVELAVTLGNELVPSRLVQQYDVRPRLGYEFFIRGTGLGLYGGFGGHLGVSVLQRQRVPGGRTPSPRFGGGFVLPSLGLRWRHWKWPYLGPMIGWDLSNDWTATSTIPRGARRRLSHTLMAGLMIAFRKADPDRVRVTLQLTYAPRVAVPVHRFDVAVGETVEIARENRWGLQLGIHWRPRAR